MSGTAAGYIALNGDAAHAQGAVALGESYTSIAALRLPRLDIRAQEFTAGPLPMGEALAFDTDTAIGMRLDEEYGLHGGRLRLGFGEVPVGPDGAEYWELGPAGHGRPKPIRVGIWEGTAFSVITLKYGGQSTDLLSIFDQVVVSEHPQGLTVLPKPGSQAYFVEGPVILQEVPGLGLLDIRRRGDRGAGVVPRRHGTPVDGGELFVRNRGEPTMSFLLVGDTAQTNVIPDLGLPEDRLVHWVSTLIVTWSAGP